MSKLALEALWEKFQKYFLFGKRWILLIPFVLVPMIYQFIKEVLSLPDFRETITSPPFFITSLFVVIACLICFWYFAHRPVRKDKIIIAVTKFFPVSEDAEGEAANTCDEVIETISERIRENNIYGEIKVLDETIDPRYEDGKKQAHTLGKHYQAHIVVSGTVRVDKDEKFYFHPHISILDINPNRYSPRGDEAAKIKSVPYQSRIDFREEKTNEITDLSLFICGMAKLNSFQYEETDKILSTVTNPPAVVWFYRGFSMLQLGKTEEALHFFERSYQQDPMFHYAHLYAGIAHDRLGHQKQAMEQMVIASDLVKKEISSATYEDKYLVIEVLKDVVERLKEIQEKIVEFPDPYPKPVNFGKAYEFQMEGDNYFLEEEYEKSIEKYDQVIKLVSDDGLAWASRGFAFYQLGNIGQAEYSLRKAIELNCGEFILARAYAILGDRGSTLEHLSMAIKEEGPGLGVALRVYDEFSPYKNDQEFIKLTNEAMDKLSNPPLAK